MGNKAWYKTAIWSSIGIILIALYFVSDWFEPRAKSLPFPNGYITQNKPSIYLDGPIDNFTREFLYDLVIEDIVDFVVIDNGLRDPRTRQVVGAKYIRVTKSTDRMECAGADISPAQSTAVWLVARREFDALSGKCVLVQQVDQNHADLRLKEYDAFWSVEEQSTGKQIASAPKAYRRKEVRALFGERANLSQQPASPVFRDTFTDDELVAAIETGGNMARAAASIIGRRVRLDDTGLVPKVSVREPVSPDVVAALLDLMAAGNDTGKPLVTFVPLTSGASPETAELMFPGIVESLYAPLKTSDPYGPSYYGTRWKKQVRDKRPNLEDEYVRMDYVPVYATMNFRTASALVLQLGQPYVERFYDEFKTEIVNRNLSNRAPSFDTAILAQSEPDIVSIISEIRRSTPTPAQIATIWALIQQSPNLPSTFIDELRAGCDADPDFLNKRFASEKFLNGKRFCSHFFENPERGLTR